MNAQALNRARSEFNHAWLKNRLILTLNRAMQGLRGRLQDDTIWGDLVAILADWPIRRAEALHMLDEFSNTENPAREMVQSVLPDATQEIRDWLAAVIHLRRGGADVCRSKVIIARLAFEEFDSKVQQFTGLSIQEAKGSPPAAVAKLVQDLRGAADQLAQAFSELGGVSI